jgi:hypothetical protein
MRSLTAQVKWLGADPTTVAGRAGVGQSGAAAAASGTRVTRVVGWPQPFAIIAYCLGSDDDEDLYFL